MRNSDNFEKTRRRRKSDKKQNRKRSRRDHVRRGKDRQTEPSDENQKLTPESVGYF
jgi:hypothetical protein